MMSPSEGAEPTCHVTEMLGRGLALADSHHTTKKAATSGPVRWRPRRHRLQLSTAFLYRQSSEPNEAAD